MRLLLVDDDPALTDGLSRLLAGIGYEVELAGDLAMARSALKRGGFDVAILDLVLARGNGLQLLAEFKSLFSTLPVLVLSGCGTLRDKLRAFELGASDYLAKPFEFPELGARLKAICRRHAEPDRHLLRFADLELNLHTHTATLRGEEVALSRREFCILRSLVEHPGQIVTRAVLERAFDRQVRELASNSIEVHIHNLRKKLPAKVIRTVHGLGYTLSVPAA